METTRFEELKKEILIRAHKAEACREQYGRAYGAETLDALMEVVRDNFNWCCDNDVLDGDIIDRYKAEFNAGKIWHNETRVTDGMLLLDNSRAVLLDNSRAVLRDNSSAVLLDNSRAVLLGNSSAELLDNSRAVLRGNSSAVLLDNSRAVLLDNSRAVLRGNSYGMSYSIKECKLHDHAIYRICETNEIRYVDESIRFVKVEEEEL